MSVFDTIARLIGHVMRAWMEGCALHARAEAGQLQDAADL